MAQRITIQRKVKRIVTVEEIIEEHVIESIPSPMSTLRTGASRQDPSSCSSTNQSVAENEKRGFESQSDISKMFYAFKICNVCDRRFLTDKGFDSHLTKHRNATGESLPAELKTNPGSQDWDVNPEPSKVGHEARAEADDQGAKGPVVAATETRQRPTIASDSSNFSVDVEAHDEPTDFISRSPIQSEKRKMVGESRNPQSKKSKFEGDSESKFRYSTKSPPAISEEDYEKEESEKRRHKQSMATSGSVEPAFTYEDDYEEENFSSMTFSENDDNKQTQWTNPAKRKLVFKEDEKKTSALHNNANWEEVSNSLVWKCMMGWLEQGNKAYREKYNFRMPHNYTRRNSNSSKSTNIINKNNSTNEPNNSNRTQNEEDEVTILYYSKDPQ